MVNAGKGATYFMNPTPESCTSDSLCAGIQSPQERARFMEVLENLADMLWEQHPVFSSVRSVMEQDRALRENRITITA